MTFPTPAGETIAMVTVSYASRDVLGPFLESITGSSVRDIRVTIADNKSSVIDGVQDLARNASADYLALDSNIGYGGAVNAAVEQIDPRVDWIVISNPDVVLHPGSVDKLLACGVEDEAIGAVGPAIYTSQGELYPSARSLPSLRTGVGHALFSNLWTGNPWTRAYRNEEGEPRERDAGWLSGAFLLVRRSAFDAVGGFDPDYFMYFEDVDLGYRLSKAGYRSVYLPSASVTHTGAHSTNTNADAMITAHHASARKYLMGRYSGRLMAPVRWSIGLSLAVRSAIVRHRARTAASR